MAGAWARILLSWLWSGRRLLASASLALVVVLMAPGCGIVLMEPVPPENVGDTGFDGSVIDIETGAAISNARVRIDSISDPGVYFEAFTDVQGKFNIRYLRRGNDQIPLKKGERYQVTVSSADYRTSRRPETFKGKVQPLQIGLAKFEDNQRKPDAPVPPSPDRAVDPHFRSGPPIP